MDNIVLETSPNPIVEISNVGGDLRVTGWEQAQFVAESDDDNEMHFEHDGDQLRLQANSDCTIRLPYGAQVSVRNVGGDAKIIKLTEQKLSIGSVGGDLILRQIAGANVGVVGGDASLKRVSGDVQVGSTGGDLEAREVGGAFKSGNVGGDLFLQEVGGAIQGIAGGDATLSVTFKPEQEYSVQAGSDLTCRVGPDASVRMTLTAGDTVNVSVPAAQVVGNSNRKTVTLGAGAAAANLRAGGEVNLTGGGFEAGNLGDFDEKFGEDFDAQIESLISAHMADFDKLMDERMAGLNFMGNSVDAAKIAATARQAAERVQRAGRQQAEAARRQAEREAERAQRIAEAAQRRAEAINRKVREDQPRRGWPFRGEPLRQPPTPPAPPRPFGPGAPPAPTPPSDPVSDEERMTILRMVEQGKISVVEAEKLLAAMENKS